MKRQCDEKRSLYEYMVAQQREKGKSKSAKLENFTSQELQAARDEYDQEATLCVFRLKSLKQGQCRSLLTQAARHHAAQLKFFRKGLQSLEAIEPHIRAIAEKQHIDYQVSGLDDGEDGEDEDQVGLPRPQVSTVENAEAILNKSLGEQIFNRETRISSYSAPIFAEKKFDPAERIREMQQSSARKYHSYVLPTPIDVKSSTSTRTNSSVMQLRPTSHTGDTQSLWHSSPLEPEKHEKGFTDDNSSVPTIAKAHLNLKAGSSNNLSVQLPPSLAQGLSRDAHNAYDAKKLKRQAFSGPLTIPTPQPSSSSPKVSPSASPPIASSPRISELHELPRPPGGLASKPVSSSTGHSAPLVFRNQELSPTNKSPAGAFSTASRLPTPPLTIPRCFSIPSSNQRATARPVAKLLGCPELPEKTEEVTSPPLTPMSLSNNKLLSTASEVASHSGQIKVERNVVILVSWPTLHPENILEVFLAWIAWIALMHR
ncbi:hydroxyproline-rich glycoprotein family protein [Actinidia rufa]|uniref:Hydroxyproline-rich glycoprotein family protein n=1 Tax=Actinidia rufa TaxID=165716 RepID=A0A7J0EKZ5_9ERIC|nr:hydroxyproline-rich glycoprotein family protein [Actinidia rufa]